MISAAGRVGALFTSRDRLADILLHGPARRLAYQAHFIERIVTANVLTQRDEPRPNLKKVAARRRGPFFSSLAMHSRDHELAAHEAVHLHDRRAFQNTYNVWVMPVFKILNQARANAPAH